MNQAPALFAHLINGIGAVHLEGGSSIYQPAVPNVKSVLSDKEMCELELAIQLSLASIAYTEVHMVPIFDHYWGSPYWLLRTTNDDVDARNVIVTSPFTSMPAQLYRQRALVPAVMTSCTALDSKRDREYMRVAYVNRVALLHCPDAVFRIIQE